MINIPPMAERIKKRREARAMMAGRFQLQVVMLPQEKRTIWNLWGLL